MTTWWSTAASAAAAPVIQGCQVTRQINVQKPVQANKACCWAEQLLDDLDISERRRVQGLGARQKKRLVAVCPTSSGTGDAQSVSLKLRRPSSTRPDRWGSRAGFCGLGPTRARASLLPRDGHVAER
ncbi:hypothetical protein [Streptomyces sodiiphilus]|uniref:hypothetical protein n=1 Tax=Streptomyces sodiiphilus TaxID=226217 RepID=UPI003CD06771